jgi:Zn-dependent peptidase ImmA (M78 family)
MNSHSDTIERARVIFGDAARRAVVPLTSSEVDDLSQRILLSIDVRPNTAAKLKEVTSQLDFRPSNAVAMQMAMLLRYFLRVGDVDPLFNLPSLLDERLNVFLFPMEQSKLAGACALIDGSAFIFISDAAKDETLFTCAHELAHLAMLSARRSNDARAIFDPVDNEAFSLRGPYEYFADAFALEFLIPSRGLGIALQQVRKCLNVTTVSVGDVELLYLSRIFGVNFLAIARRCERAQLLPKGGAASLNKFLIENFGGPERRAEELGLPPRTTIKTAPVPRSIELAIIKQLESIGREGSSSTISTEKGIHASASVGRL